MLDVGMDIDGFSETRERIYPSYVPGDTRIEGFCTFSELKQRIERLEKIIGQLQAESDRSPG
jgi:hypothetical protein